MDIIYSIYKAENLINGKVYIGFDSNWPSRKYKHKSNSLKKYNQALYLAINKYGWDNFKWEVIYQSKDKTHCLRDMEPYFILEYNSYLHGYNMTVGGDGAIGYKHSNEMKKYISECAKGRTFKHTDATKKKIGDKLRNRKYTDEQLKNYGKSYNITTPTGEMFVIKNLNKFCRENNLDTGHMIRVAKGVRPSHKKYKCEYYNE